MLKLAQIAEEIEIIVDDYLGFLDKTTGEVIRVEETVCGIAEEYEEGDELQLDEWQLDEFKNALLIFANEDNYQQLPSKYEVDNYGIMASFCREYPNELVSDRLCSLIRGSGAFRRFKNAIRNYDIEEKWYAHQRLCYMDIARNWCEDNNIEFEE